jgi:hypothetical protein
MDRRGSRGSRFNLGKFVASIEHGEMVAIACGDTNPIHYENPKKWGLNEGFENYLSEPICAGVYLLGLAEMALRRGGNIVLPMEVSANFKRGVCEGDEIEMEGFYPLDGREPIKVNYTKKGIAVAEFGFKRIPVGSAPKKSLERYNLDHLEVQQSEISENDLELVRQGLGIIDNTPSSILAAGKVIGNFLKPERKGTMLFDVKFDLYEAPKLGPVETNVIVQETPKYHSKHPERKLKSSYEILGDCLQDGRVIGFGGGYGRVKHRKAA